MTISGKKQVNRLEEGVDIQLDFDKIKKAANCGEALIPAIAQEADTGEILILGYVNQAAMDYSAKNRVATFWSTSRNELWIKGKTSGDYLDLAETQVNCEQNSILYLVRLRGSGACHTKNADGTSRKSCYYRKVENGKLRFL